MAQVIITPRAQADVDEMITTLNLPADTWSRIDHSLRVVKTFPLSGRALDGSWSDLRFVLGPWNWMLLLYFHEATTDQIYVVAVHDGRSATSATAR